MKKLLYILCLTLFFTNCKKQETETSINFHYNYIPTTIGTWAEYQVKEIFHTNTGAHDTIYYLIKEVVAEELEQNNFRFERFKRTNNTEPWVIEDVWTRSINTTHFIQTEENIKFTKLIFPVKKDQNWNGNAFNNFDNLDYEYSNVHEAYSNHNLNFDSTVTVIQQDNVNAIEYQKANEIYAKNVGLIYKEKIDLDINFFDKTDINEGSELEITLISYGN